MAEKKKNVKAEEKTDKINTAPESEPAEETAPDPRDAEIERLSAELEKQKDLLLRTAAEFDNYKRRKEKESISAAEYTKAKLLKELLPVFDNVDRALTADKESADYSKGVELTVKMLKDTAEKLGLKEIGKEGETFDPNFHEAVMHIEDESLGENVISKVLQKGYMIGDTCIRPAMVQVAN